MEKKATIDRIVSSERFAPYMHYNKQDFSKALNHYKVNILISESFYPILSMLEVRLRNAMAYQLSKKFKDQEWYNHHDFIKVATRFQIDKLSQARTNIQSEKKEVTPGRIVSELSFGFWTSLFDAKFEMTLWKNLRLAFPNCPKKIRKRKTMSSKFNGIRKLRNRIFHHEAISWDLNALDTYHKEIIEGIAWLNPELLGWVQELNRVEKVLNNFRNSSTDKS